MTLDTLSAVVKKLHSLGLDIVASVSDMGSENEKMWRLAGVTDTSPSIPHPADPTR